MGEFTYKNDKFYKNGEEYRIYSGAIHYFRVLPKSWKDRLIKLKNVGFNTVETYISWNLHERKEGVFDFSGRLDLARFIDEASSLGLNVIVRPGPYICAEVDFGGLPSWLLKYSDIELRCYNEIFMEKVENYYREISKILKPRLITNGGNIIMLQVENEYGSYGNDKKYKNALVQLNRKYGLDCLLFTADGNEEIMLENGYINGCVQGLTFGSKPNINFDKKLTKPNQPKVCFEYWNGWFDYYGEEHHTRGAESVGDETKQFITSGASFNFYMFTGGTNFEMINGANYQDKKYLFQTSSYDYDALLTESGDMTSKYYTVKKMMEECTGNKFDLPIKNSEKEIYPTLKAKEFAPLLTNLPKNVVYSAFPKTFESLGVDFGYVLYSTTVKILNDNELWLRGLRDRATVLVDGKVIGVLDKELNNCKMPIKKTDCEVRLDILVENRGRCNYGYQLKDYKGILSGALIDNKFLLQYSNYGITTDIINNLKFESLSASDLQTIGYYKFELNIEGTPKDTFILPEKFKNGCIFVNGFNVGRFCNVLPPQLTNYIPQELLKTGKNEIVIFETDGDIEEPIISFSDRHKYSK